MHKRGEEHYAAKLTADDVRIIRAAGRERKKHLIEAAKLSDRVLADKFGVSKSSIGMIINKRKWGCV